MAQESKDQYRFAEPKNQKKRTKGCFKKFKNQAFSAAKYDEEKGLGIEWESKLMEKQALTGIEWELPKPKEDKDKVADE